MWGTIGKKNSFQSPFQMEYESEGIAWKCVPYTDNKLCVDALDGSTGVFGVLNEVCWQIILHVSMWSKVFSLKKVLVLLRDVVNGANQLVGGSFVRFYVELIVFQFSIKLLFSIFSNMIEAYSYWVFQIFGIKKMHIV